MNAKFHFDLLATQKRARAGVFHTPHGDIQTPIFAPVGTQASVKSVTPLQLEDLDATLVLANTYHLYLRPGDELISNLGGLHTFMQWPHPILTDSGGFQVFSLAENRKIDEDGVTFKSHIDGSIHRLTPEKSIAIQEHLGADIVMAFDECALPDDRTYNQRALVRTHAWAERCLHAHQRSDQALFGIVQGGVFPDLREQSAAFIASLRFPGNAIGGLSVDKPRYLMGVGAPEDLVNGVIRGVDIFDCVLPTRLARHHAAITRTGRINMVNAIHQDDPKPISESCTCYTCQHFSRAYLRHLIIAKEMLAATLLTLHNLHTVLHLMKELRQSIIDGTLETFSAQFFAEQEQSN
jgi:queuine tRNA-ribosyltransferase